MKALHKTASLLLLACLLLTLSACGSSNTPSDAGVFYNVGTEIRPRQKTVSPPEEPRSPAPVPPQRCGKPADRYRQE